MGITFKLENKSNVKMIIFFHERITNSISVFKKLTYHYYYADIDGLTSGGTNS